VCPEWVPRWSILSPVLETEPQEPQFIDYLRVVQRRKGWVISATLLVLAAALAYSFAETKVYTASATVLVQPTTTPGLDQSGPQNTVGAAQIQTDAQLLTSVPVKDLVYTGIRGVFKGIPGAPTPSVKTSPSDDLLTVSASSGTAVGAANIANAYALAFVKIQKQNLNLAYSQVVSSLNNQILALTVQEKLLQKQIPASTTKVSIQTQALETQISALVNEGTGLAQTLAQVKIEQVSATGGVTVTSAAVAPKNPSAPKPSRDGAIGGLAGLVLGLLLAFGVDSVDDTVKSREDIERAFPRLPILGMIPFIESWKTPSEPQIASLDPRPSATSEAYRSLRTALQFARIDRDVKSLLITSAVAIEGKTATLANTAVTFSRSGSRTLVVSADLRRPRIGQFLGMSEEVGLSSVALGTATLDEAIQPVTDVPGLFFLGSGPLPAEAADFLASERVAEIFRSLKESFDIVLIDTPPIVPVTDAIVMTRYVDSVLLVISQGRTRRRSLARMRELLAHASAPIIGAVLNSTTTEARGYGYGYGYGYGSYTPYVAGGHDGARHSARGSRRSKGESNKLSKASNIDRREATG
jgi:capsular exopolysaccharide synthesis family protein